MIETGNRLKWTTGILSLLALLILAYSGYKLSLLYNTHLVGISAESRQARQKWNQLENLISQKEKTDWSKSIGLLIKDIPEVEPKALKTISSQEIQQVARYKKVTLPEISGIIVTSSPIDSPSASVIIQGSVYSENDEVSGYMISKIAENGVSLTKNGRHYFIDAPDAPYSVDKGN